MHKREKQSPQEIPREKPTPGYDSGKRGIQPTKPAYPNPPRPVNYCRDDSVPYRTIPPKKYDFD
jgi:hypothetical protein